MMRRHAAAVLATVLIAAAPCVAAAAAQRAGTTVLRIGGFSSQSGGSGSIGGSISAGGEGAGHSSPSPPAGSGNSTQAPPPPTLASNAPILSDPTPAGPGSFWYTSPSGRCIYRPAASPICYVIVAPTAPQLDVAATAASLARELELTLAPIEANPAADQDGLTGAESWFWLDSAPRTRSLSLTLDGVTVSVSASPGEVEWSFGDGSSLEGGPGSPFAQGSPPPGAVTHLFGTRCLPGDQGVDPYVLPSCGPGGYLVSARVSWTVTFAAVGAINQRGELDPIQTTSTLLYPVSEARSFLVGAAG